MSEAPRQTAEINLLGQSYVISCGTDEYDALMRSAEYLDRALKGIQSRSKAMSNEKAALMAALNIAHELMREVEARKESESRLAALTEQLDKALIDSPVTR
ncbi:cell division protein ZapA [Phytohalomonas tamaricis]|uniref:cell division protein ZapA n=1 Tax=Phytohalomonas tamaricis TaxID=2081032 RepID=UPI000D0BBAAB|nr:cell division protein ZapA [Phytohalomonas tamaricis]